MFASKEHWDENWGKRSTLYKPHNCDHVCFADIFSKYIREDPNKTVLEIGCAGGSYLCHLAKKYRLQPYGIDFSDEIKTTEKTFAFNGLPSPTLYKDDFLKWQTAKRFDVVCSFGFVEHFENLHSIIAKHANLVLPNGLLIITLPHFRNIQYILRYIFDKEDLRRHNTKIMTLHAVRSAFGNLPFTILYLSYYQTFLFWTKNKKDFLGRQKVEFLIDCFDRVMTKLLGADMPNALASPFIVCVAQRNR